MSLYELPPEKYHLRGAGFVLDGMRNDPEIVLAEMDEEYTPSGLGDYVDMISDTVVPSDDEHDSGDIRLRNERRMAIRTSGLVVLTSFMESDFPEPASTDTLNQLLRIEPPVSLTAQDETKRFAAFARMGLTGLTLHPEARDLADNMQHHFFIAWRDETTANLARHSVGFMLHMLDMSWQIARDDLLQKEDDSLQRELVTLAIEQNDIEKVIARETADLDWSQLLPEIPGDS